MKQKVMYTDKQPNVRYQKISESKADVIVNEFIGEEVMIIDPEKNIKQTMYAYWSNTLVVNPMLVTEVDIKNNFTQYLNYEEQKKLSIEDEVATLKEQVTNTQTAVDFILMNGMV